MTIKELRDLQIEVECNISDGCTVYQMVKYLIGDSILQIWSSRGKNKFIVFEQLVSLIIWSSEGIIPLQGEFTPNLLSRFDLVQ